jgi:hypothetical protein
MKPIAERISIVFELDDAEVHDAAYEDAAQFYLPLRDGWQYEDKEWLSDTQVEVTFARDIG